MTERVVAPKLGQNINKRFRVYTASLLLTLALFLFQVLFKSTLDVGGVTIVAGAFGLLTVALGMWVVRFKGNIVLFFKIFLLPFLLISVITFTLKQVFFDELTRVADLALFLAILGIFGLVMYIILLAANILFISDKKTIPLVQVAHTAWYILTLAMVFLFTYWTLVSGESFYLTLPTLAIMYILLSFQHLSHFELSNRTLINKSVGIALAMISSVLVVSFWPAEVWVRAFTAAIIGYIGLGLTMHEVKKVLETRVVIEYAVLAIFLIFIILYTSDWGIFGKIFTH